MTPQIGLRRAFVTRGTVITGLLSVAAFGLLWGWTVSLMVVFLLYIHELGHVGGALWRKVPVHRGPLFIPGVGAFVMVGPAAHVWDDVLISLAGPVVGAVAALATVLTSIAAGSPALMFAGNIGLLLNLANLLPFSPLDGGHVVNRLGWIGLVPPVAIGAILLATLAYVRIASPFVVIIIAVGVALGVQAARTRTKVTWTTRFGILGLYFAVGVALTLVFALTLIPASTWSAIAARRGGLTPASPKPVRYDGPVGVAVGGDGTVYVIDPSGNRVRTLSPGGKALTAWGSAGSGSGQFAGPQALALDSSGNIYVGDTGNARVQKLSPRGEPLAQWGKEGAGNGEFAQISAVAVDKTGNVYVADADNNAIQKLSPLGQPTARWGAAGTGPAQFDGPQGVAVDSQNHVYVSDTGNDRISVFSSEGEPLKQWGTRGEGAGQFLAPVGIAVDHAGNVYVADSGNQRVQKLSADGQPLAQWDVKGAGDFSLPNAIALGSDGALYVADPTSHDIRQLGASSALTPGRPPYIVRREAQKSASNVRTRLGFAQRPTWAPDVWPLFEWGGVALIVLAVLDGVVWRFAMRSERGAASRYVVLALLGWPRLLLHNARMVPVIGCAGLHVVGLPGLRWLEALIRRWSRQRDSFAGMGCAHGYDCLRRQRAGAEVAWMERMTPVLQAGGPEVTHKAFAYGLSLGPRKALYEWFARAMAGMDHAGLSWLASNNLAYSLAMVGRPAEGLDLARAAVAAAPDSSYPHGTLGEILIAMDSPIEAEAQLRAALAIAENPINRVALARALAAQRHFADGVKEAEHALKTHSGPWKDDEPSQEYILTRIAEWTAAAAAIRDETPITA